MPTIWQNAELATYTDEELKKLLPAGSFVTWPENVKQIYKQYIDLRIALGEQITNIINNMYLPAPNPEVAAKAQIVLQTSRKEIDLLEKQIKENSEFALTEEVELRLPSNGKGLTRFGGRGICSLNWEGLTYTGMKDGQQVKLNYPLQKVYRVLFGAGQNFEIDDGTEILYFVPNDKRTAVDWYMASMILYDEKADA